jgi:thioesterase domain-containing protein
LDEEIGNAFGVIDEQVARGPAHESRAGLPRGLAGRKEPAISGPGSNRYAKTPLGPDGMYTDCDWAAKIGIPARIGVMDKDQLRQIAMTAGLSSKPIIPLSDDALEPQSTAPSFYCVHPISGAGATYYIDLALEIGQGVRFFGIQAPATLMKNADYKDLLQSIASHYADAIQKFQPNGQIHVGGYSAGTLVALETARQLKAKGREVSTLFIFDGAPKNARYSGSRLVYFAKVLWNLPGALLNDDFAQIATEFLFKIRNSGGKKESPQTNQDDGHPVQGFIPNFSQYPGYRQAFMVGLYEAIEKTAFLPYDGAVVVYKARIKPILLSGVQEFWTSIAQHCEVVEVRATHFNMMMSPQVVPLAADLKQRLTGKVPPRPR